MGVVDDLNGVALLLSSAATQRAQPLLKSSGTLKNPRVEER